MAILEILVYPDTRLRTVAKPVETVDDSIRQLVKDMTDTMYEANGIGLAATQVNVHRQVIVMEVLKSQLWTSKVKYTNLRLRVYLQYAFNTKWITLLVKSLSTISRA